MLKVCDFPVFSFPPSVQPMNHLSYLNQMCLQKVLMVPIVIMFLALFSTERVSCPTVDKYFMM